MPFETEFPYIQTPKLLENDDPLIRKMFRSQFKKRNPKWYKWHWMQGIELAPGEGEMDDFQNPLWHWINQNYAIGNGRIVESIEKSTANSYIELGGGFRLLAGIGNPHLKQKLPYENVFMLEFLYQKPNHLDRADGVRRLRKFIKYIEQMPGNTIREIVLQPMGSEILDLWAPHYDTFDYKRTNHTTEDLIKIYKRVLGIQPTPVTDSVWPEGTYFFWRAKYDPIDCIYSKEQCTCPQLYEDIDKHEDINRRFL
jgi:hypothetical protein